MTLNGWGLVLFLALVVYAAALLLILALCRIAKSSDERLRRMAVERVRGRADRQRSDLDWAEDMGRQWEQIRCLPTHPDFKRPERPR